jgi:hypothetical protein
MAYVGIYPTYAIFLTLLGSHAIQTTFNVVTLPSIREL